jgi:SPP1 gp7 family putative phage head morphogenesis protein
MPSLFDSQFWQSEEAALWESLSGLYLSALFAGMEGGVDILPPELQTLVNFDALNHDALDFASKYRYELISKINETTRTQVQEAITKWISSGDPLSVLENQLAPIFGKVRAQMIAVTEVTRVFAEGNISAWNSTGFVDSFSWETARDERVCPICTPRAGQIYKLTDSSNKPPGHVRCRCWIRPVVNVDLVNKQVERILNG